MAGIFPKMFTFAKILLKEFETILEYDCVWWQKGTSEERRKKVKKSQDFFTFFLLSSLVF